MTHTTHLLVSGWQDESLAEFGTSLFDALMIEDYECRQSTNYVDEEYFLAVSGDLRLTVSWSDEPGFEEFMFWIMTYGMPCGRNGAVIFIDDAISGRMITQGRRVVHVLNFGKQ